MPIGLVACCKRKLGLAAPARGVERHTSGHIYATDIVKFVQGVNPRRVIPIHTTQSVEFRKHFPNVLHLKDGENWEVAR